jgi:hypothetical protein
MASSLLIELRLHRPLQLHVCQTRAVPGTLALSIRSLRVSGSLAARNGARCGRRVALHHRAHRDARLVAGP